MRIHHLNFQAIGPYPTEQCLAFQDLDDVGLFLLDGPTGAGKSTILDVVTFALYGKADDERKNTELHSTLAEPGVAPTITLDVSFGNRRFIIDRTLQHFAPRRGAKTADDVVTRQASMVLQEMVAGQPKQLTTRVDEAQQILRSVIGLSREQFTSVVLLPQGDFARFLKASSSDREAILRQLFHTHRFDEIGDYLAQQAKALRGTVEADTERRQTLRTSLAEVAQRYAPAEDREFDTLSDAELVEHVETTMSARENQAQQRVTDATTTLDAAGKTLQKLQQQQEYIHEATDYRRRRSVHESHTQAAQDARQQLEHHKRATPVVDAQTQLRAAQQQLDTTVADWQQQFHDARQHDLIIEWAAGQELFTVHLDATQRLLDGWKTVEAAAIRTLEHVAQHQKTQAKITAGRQQIAQWKASRDQLTQHIADLQQQYDTVSQQLTTDRAEAEKLSGVEQALNTAIQRLDDATAKQTAAQQAQTAQTAADQAGTTQQQAQRDADDALAHAQALLRRRIEAAAGFLAEQLVDGTPCQVCGSTTHPNPARVAGLAEISNDAVQQAEDRATQARRAANDAEQTHQTKLAALQKFQTQAGGLSVTDANAAVAQAQHTVTTAQQNVTTLADIRARIKANETQSEHLRTAKTTAEQQLTEVTTQLTTLTEELDRSEADLTHALGAFDTVSAFRAAVEPAHRLVGQIVQQGSAVVTALASHTTAKHRVTEALQHSATQQHAAFDTIDQAQDHLLDDHLVQAHEALVRQWTTEHDRLAEKATQTAVIAGLKLLDDGVPAPSEAALEAAQNAQQVAQTSLADANREHGSIQATRTQTQHQQHQLTEVSERSAEHLAVYEELVGLSDVVAGRGENAVNMPLRSFVLAGWLEQVAANASERLTGMTGGRYELQHAVGQGGRGYAGLNLEIIDHLNDTVRSPSTLSGGETFMASLALALGLADAVQAQAGGMAMDTLFIDEGFGSLDAETLEDVMSVLDTLQDDGRLIGLVSHVDSMKQQIPHRIQVQKAQTGSTVQIIGPDLG